MRIRQKANTTDRRLVEFKYVSLYFSGLTLHIGEILNFAQPPLTTTLWYFILDVAIANLLRLILIMKGVFKN